MIVKITADLYFEIDDKTKITNADMLRSAEVIRDELDEDTKPDMILVTAQRFYGRASSEIGAGIRPDYHTVQCGKGVLI